MTKNLIKNNLKKKGIFIVALLILIALCQILKKFRLLHIKTMSLCLVRFNCKIFKSSWFEILKLDFPCSI